MVMQHALRPYATSGIALVGAGLIAVTPVAPPSVVQLQAVQLATISYEDLFTDTAANLQNIFDGADSQAISSVLGELFTNPLGVISALTNLTPDVTTDLTSLPATVSVQLPPGLELAIADFGAMAITLNAIHSATADAMNGDFSALFNALPGILNAFLNGQDNISLLGGVINIPVFNGILAPEQSLSVDLNLTNLLDALGLGNLDLTNLDLSKLLGDIDLSNLTLGKLFSDLGIATKGLGDLLGNPSLGTLLSDLGLSGLGLGSLTDVLNSLGLDTNVDLNSISLDSVLQALGVNPNIDIGLGALMSNLGLGSLVNEPLGTLVSGLPNGVLNGVVSSLNGVLEGLIKGIPGIGLLLNTVLGAVTLTPKIWRAR